MAMACNIRLINVIKQSQLLSMQCRKFCSNRIVYNNPPATNTGSPVIQSQTESVKDVPGLSQNVLTTLEPVGPGASKAGDYKNPEFFNYSVMSYHEAEVEMLKFRLPQPSTAQKYFHLKK